MSLALQIVLMVAVSALTVALVLFLLQARRTARAVEHLAESARGDLSRIAEDVHEVRLRVDEVAVVARKGLDLPAALGQMATTVAQSIPGLFRRSEPGWLGTLTTLFQAIRPFFRKS